MADIPAAALSLLGLNICQRDASYERVHHAAATTRRGLCVRGDT